MKKRCLSFFLIICAANAWTKHHIIDLTVSYDTFNFTGYPSRAITINHQSQRQRFDLKKGMRLQ